LRETIDVVCAIRKTGFPLHADGQPSLPGMSTTGPSDLPVVNYESIPPSPKGAVRALARIGYRLEEALADIVDNSIDARAKTVLVCFVYLGTTVKRIVIADDGVGMTESKLRDAMKVGADDSFSPSNLGKYGTGMKTASFSQCNQMTVISRANGQSNGRSWARREAESGWRCGIIDPRAAARLLDAGWSSLKLDRHGTLVIWDELEHLQPRTAAVDQYLKGLLRRAGLHLGMVFHRFLERKSVSLRLEVRREASKSADIDLDVAPVNPFRYPSSGDPHYPTDFIFNLDAIGRLKATAHIWPKKSMSIEYKLGTGKVAERQGFYFYRNDRLIQAGGWNGVINQDDEPHLSLARVEISLPPTMDDAFGLSVQKNAVEVPPSFADAVDRARSGSLSFERYRADARAAYGRMAPKPVRELPVVLGNGVHQNIRSRVAKEFGEGQKQLNKVRIRWTRNLEDGTLFDVDIHQRQILLNSRYQAAYGGTAADDGGLMKALLFLLVRDVFQKKKTSAKRAAWLSHCNKVLLAAWHSRS
jgi:hypothetical protein